MIPTLSAVPQEIYKALVWVVVTSLLWYWLRKELTPRKFLSIVESEGVLSTRLILGFAVVIYCMFMDAANRMTNTRLETWLLFSGTLLGLGIAKVVGKAIAASPSATTVNSKQTTIDADKVNVNNQPPAPGSTE